MTKDNAAVEPPRKGPRPRRAKTQAVAVVEPRPMDVDSLIAHAVQIGNLDIVDRMMTLRERNKQYFSRQAFDNAIAAAKSEIPVIKKNREVDFTSAKGRTNYKYEDMAEIARTVDPVLSKHGLSYRYRTTSLPNEPVTVTCILSHRDGHSEENTLSAARDESGNKNNIQAIGSTITFLQRYTLKAALGLAAEVDDDGVRSSIDTITISQAADIEALLSETKTDREKFLKLAGADRVDAIAASKYGNAIGFLKTKLQGMVKQ